ncbi:hypothetical protein GDO86_005446 [Hymenochirus boettgeri]|uniref:SOWAHA-C winged helix-turn-helix domain-containing protein n=1 Tax=Hymenochirus boettgeri TaxID=247094 RepID=A0A8T2J4I1_9PIPI|nr:hypothetical protein GDO86_005446 [Hymenochirus boettgeri]
MAVTQEDVLNFLLDQGGKVRNSELLRKFKPVVDCSDPQQKAQNRERFKRFVNNIAVVKGETEGKMVVLKKKYFSLASGAGGDKESETIQVTGNHEEAGTQTGNTAQHKANQMNSDVAAPGTECKPSYQNPLPENLNQTDRQPSDMAAPGTECKPSYQNPLPENLNQTDRRSSLQDDKENVSVESNRETVFDIVSRIDNAGPVPVPKSFIDMSAKDSAPKPYMLPLRYPQNAVASEEGQSEQIPKQANTTSKLKEEKVRPVQPRSPHVSRRQYDDTATRSPHLKRASKMQKVTEENRYSDVVPLDLTEHEWLVKATSGHWNHTLYGLLLKDNHLAGKKDFISGFTALHWAAKSGNCEMIKILMDAARKNDIKLNINVKSFGGYTPLHIAAIHDHAEIIKILVMNYNANTDLRDHSGKKPFHYLNKDSPLRILLNDPNSISTNQVLPAKRNSKVAASILGTTFLGVIPDEATIPDFTKNFKKPSSLNKFFTAPTGPKKKHRARDSFPSFTSLNEEQEDEIEETVVKRRPHSDFMSH